MAVVVSRGLAGQRASPPAGARRRPQPRPSPPTSSCSSSYAGAPRYAGVHAASERVTQTALDDVAAEEKYARLVIKKAGYGKVVPVADLWTTVFLEYYYGLTDSPSLARRLNEFAYFCTMLNSATTAVSEEDSFCAIALSEEKNSGGLVAGLAARVLTEANCGVFFREKEWTEMLGGGEFGVPGDSLSLLYLWNFGVCLEYRKRGVATSVMEWVENEARARGVNGTGLFVYRNNRPAISLYEKLGYRVVTTWVDPKWKRQAEKGQTGTERKLLMIKEL
ncbi:N-acetyltransferase domain-containing protein [Chloropicon primus]|nr:N-acetyltransferase domain-containing protein [Chloropicon primus]